MTLKPRAIAWRADAKIHLVDVDDRDRPLQHRTLCGTRILYGDVWNLFGDDWKEVTCKKCLKIMKTR